MDVGPPSGLEVSSFIYKSVQQRETFDYFMATITVKNWFGSYGSNGS